MIKLLEVLIQEWRVREYTTILENKKTSVYEDLASYFVISQTDLIKYGVMLAISCMRHFLYSLIKVQQINQLQLISESSFDHQFGHQSHPYINVSESE